MSQLTKAATEVARAMRQPPRVNIRQALFAATAAEVSRTLRKHISAVDREAEWQRVHSYIADVLKDTHVLYAKLARLEGDFAGEELSRLERISEAVLTLGNELSAFSKAFYEGKYDMAQSDFTYGEGGGEPPPEAPPLTDMGGESEPEGEGQGGGQAAEEEAAAAAQSESQEQEQ